MGIPPYGVETFSEPDKAMKAIFVLVAFLSTPQHASVLGVYRSWGECEAASKAAMKSSGTVVIGMMCSQTWLK